MAHELKSAPAEPKGVARHAGLRTEAIRQARISRLHLESIKRVLRREQPDFMS